MTHDDHTIWYRTPAEQWYDGLPVGNGRLGGMVYGGPRAERIVLDEATFWAGEASTDNVPPGAPANVAEIRRLLLAGEIAAANELTNAVTGRKLNYGTHLRFGNLRVVFDNSLEGCMTTAATLDLDSGMAAVAYDWYGVCFRREVFASHPDQVLVARFTCARPGWPGLAALARRR